MNLTYIELMNRFWQVDEQHSFSGNETRLYFYLLKVANALGWPAEFDHADPKTVGNTGISINTMKACRLRLVAVGFVEFEPGGKGQSDRVKYHLRYQNLTPTLTPNNPVRCQKLTPKPTSEEIKVSKKVSDKVSKIDTYTYIENKTKTFSLSKRENDFFVRCQNLIPKPLPAEPPQTPPGSAPPPLSPPVEPVDEAEAERLEFVNKLQSDRRLIEGLSRLYKLKGQPALDLIDEFVTTQWVAQNLRGRQLMDIITHCQSWIKIQLDIQKRHAPNNAPAPQPNPAAPGSVIRRQYTSVPNKPIRE